MDACWLTEMLWLNTTMTDQEKKESQSYNRKSPCCNLFMQFCGRGSFGSPTESRLLKMIKGEVSGKAGGILLTNMQRPV